MASQLFSKGGRNIHEQGINKRGHRNAPGHNRSSFRRLPGGQMAEKQEKRETSFPFDILMRDGDSAFYRIQFLSRRSYSIRRSAGRGYCSGCFRSCCCCRDPGCCPSGRQGRIIKPVRHHSAYPRECNWDLPLSAFFPIPSAWKKQWFSFLFLQCWQVFSFLSVPFSMIRM